MASEKREQSKARGSLPFGEVAVQKGYCTRKQVEEALGLQRQLGERGQPPPLLGILLVQRGFLSTGQLIDLLRTYDEQRHGKA